MKRYRLSRLHLQPFVLRFLARCPGRVLAAIGIRFLSLGSLDEFMHLYANGVEKPPMGM